MAFLASCGFNFNKAIYDGVGYMTGEYGGHLPHNSWGGDCMHVQRS